MTKEKNNLFDDEISNSKKNEDLIRFNPKSATGGIKKTLYDEISTTKDSVTGEIIESARRSVGKVSKQEEFVCIFTAGLSLLTKQNLTGGETKTLLEILKYTVNNSNMLSLSTDVRRIITKDSGLKEGTIRTNIKILKDKEILVLVGNTYFLNPLFFGRGDWNNIKTLRQEFKLEYDFENMEAREKIATHVLYEDSESVMSGEQQEIISFYDNGNKIHKEQEILLSDNSNNKKQEEIEVEAIDEVQLPQPLNEQTDLEILKEKNRSIELEIQLKKVTIEELNLKIKAHELGLI